MKVLFLDIDGVLCTTRTVAAYGHTYSGDPQFNQKLDPVGLGILRKVCQQTGTVVVISSSWRIGLQVSDFAGLELPVVDMTPDALDKTRGEEIQMWLNSQHIERQATGMQSITHYCIVDDDDDMLEDQMSHLVQVHADDGISFADYDQMLKILGHPGVYLESHTYTAR